MTEQSKVVATVHHKYVDVDGIKVFYREAGSKEKPVLLLLHGFPTSSNMFRGVIGRLGINFHVVAPDFPGYGFSDSPEPKQFAYTFDNLSKVMLSFADKLGIETFIVYLMDYGAPTGLRMALRAPERIAGLIVQNGNAYAEGLREFWDPIKKYWSAPTSENFAGLFLSDPGAAKWQYTEGVSDTTLLDPVAWTLDQALLDRPGNAEIQLALLYDYRTNLPLYPEFQAFFRKYQPPTLITWGKNDVVFPSEGAVPYTRDLPNAELHLLDAGHFALETHGDVIAGHIEEFFCRHVAEKEERVAEYA